MDQRSTFIEGKYEILGKIREGGMGAIYKVRHRLLDEIRVIKVMKPQVLKDEDLRKRFAEEAKTATRLKHPNICTIHDFSLDPDGTAYLVMEFIDGVTLAELSKSSTPVSVAMTVEIALQALLALGYLHRRNVVHRDIAPDNLMLTSDEDGGPLVKLIDLGIAKALDRPTDLTSTGVFLGKLKYASPEQYGALAPGEKIDGRSDLYCLGLVLYELLTGARPFIGETPAEMIRAHIFQPPKPFEETDPDGRVPPELRAAVLKALEKKREDRFATAEDFHRELVRLKDRRPSCHRRRQHDPVRVQRPQHATGHGDRRYPERPGPPRPSVRRPLHPAPHAPIGDGIRFGRPKGALPLVRARFVSPVGRRHGGIAVRVRPRAPPKITALVRAGCSPGRGRGGCRLRGGPLGRAFAGCDGRSCRADRRPRHRQPDAAGIGRFGCRLDAGRSARRDRDRTSGADRAGSRGGSGNHARPGARSAVAYPQSRETKTDRAAAEASVTIASRAQCRAGDRADPGSGGGPACPGSAHGRARRPRGAADAASGSCGTGRRPASRRSLELRARPTRTRSARC